MGPLKEEAIRKKYLLVMVDKFTKWIEAKPVKTAEAAPVIDFISGVVHRFGVPHCRISGSGKTLKVRTLGCARRPPLSQVLALHDLAD